MGYFSSFFCLDGVNTGQRSDCVRIACGHGVNRCVRGYPVIRINRKILPS